MASQTVCVYGGGGGGGGGAGAGTPVVSRLSHQAQLCTPEKGGWVGVITAADVIHGKGSSHQYLESNHLGLH